MIKSKLFEYPQCGVVSDSIGQTWQWAFVSGNGTMGAMVYGNPFDERIIINHCRLFLPLGSYEVLPDMGKYLSELRRIIKEKGYDEAYNFFMEKSSEQGHDKLIWTDPYHPGFIIDLKMEGKGEVRDYFRSENFETAEVKVGWTDDNGSFVRRLFVSRPDNVVVMSIRGVNEKKINLSIVMDEISHKLIKSSIEVNEDNISCHNIYVNGKGGYDGFVRIVNKGGKIEKLSKTIFINDAYEALIYMAIEPYKKIEDSSVDAIAKRLYALPTDYDSLLNEHEKIHGEIFNRVRVRFGKGDSNDKTTDELIKRAEVQNKLTLEFLEKMYNAGRYVFICSSGELPPNLQGIWTGTWSPAWSGDFTLDTNVQLAIAAGLSTNMMEGMEAYFRLIEGYLPDFRQNAQKLYGCRGILASCKASNNGLLLHFGDSWPGQFWLCGAGWLGHWFYDYYLYTGDKKFLAERAIPYLKECALFYEDFLFEDENGKYRFSPSFSAENGWADNSTQDIAVAKEVLNNLIQGCTILGIESENIEKWKQMLDKMPPYLINEEGALKEWAVEGKDENYVHRHYSHMYPIFQSHEFSPEKTPELWNASKVALEKRIEHWLRNKKADTSTHGRMHCALSAARLGMSDVVWEVLTMIATRGVLYPSMVTSHYDNHEVFNVDGNGAIPEIVNNMLVFSQPGRIDFLPALPSELPYGEIKGLLLRGQIKLDYFAWDMNKKAIKVEMTSGIEQVVNIMLPQIGEYKFANINGAFIEENNLLRLSPSKKVEFEIRF